MNTETHIFTEQALTPAARWGLGLSAILTAMNNDPQDTLYRGVSTQEDSDRIAFVMKRDWGIETRQEYLDMLEWLENEGHNAGYMHLHRRLASLSEHDKDLFIAGYSHSEDSQHKAILARNYLFILEHVGIAAWDQGRYVSLCQWGAATGVFKADEAWQMIMTMARKAQRQYHSWYQYGISYTAGRQYWRGQATRESALNEQEIVRTLTGDPNSSWRSLDWDIPLDGPVYA